MKDDEDDISEPGVYSKLDKGVGDGTHFITTSSVKTNKKTKDQLLTQVRYFMDLMCANIDFSAYGLVNNHKNHKNNEISVPHLHRNK
jgi:hypothetical protein